ncbi:hypothetical protein LLG96_01590 [bacterium]|nr:hypothetical protein [bacterium]
MRTLKRLSALFVFILIIVMSWGCSVMHSQTRGKETEKKISTRTTGYFLFIPLWTNETIITKEKEAE